MEKILQLHGSQKAEDLSKHLKTINAKDLCVLWETCVQQKPAQSSTLLNAILTGLVGDTGESRRSIVFTCALTNLQRGELTTKLTTEILGVLILETAQLSVEQLSELSSTLVDSIKSGQYGPGKWLELFPHVVSCISTRNDVPYDGGLVTGKEFQSHIIDDLCSTKWPPTFVASLAAMFKDLHLNEQELKFVFEKLFEMMGEMEYNNVPPLVYQLLELSFKGHRQMVLQELVQYFNEEDDKVNGGEQQSEYVESVDVSNRWDELKRCEGTVLLHILFAVRYDHNLGREIVKFLKLYSKLPDKVLKPFTLSVAFCIASDQTFQQPIFEILESAIKSSYKERILKENSFWIRGMTGDGSDPEEVIVAIVKKTAGDWDHVLTGLVEFGFVLLDRAKKRIFGKEQTTILRQMCQLGSTVLLNIFKENRAIRSTILKQILNNILPSESTSVNNYLELLAKSIRMSPQSYMEQLDKVRMVLDYLSFFPSSVATRLLEALQPLLKVSPTLRDGTLLILRKIMFMRQLEARKIAVSGFLLFLKNFKVIGAFSSSQSFQGSESSQLLADVHVRGRTNNNEALSLEVLGVLRRSLSQQSDVIVTLYQGLPKVLNQSFHLTDAVLDLLLKQVDKTSEETVRNVVNCVIFFIQANQCIEAGAMPPLKLKQCIQEQGSELVLTEPLPFLVKCIYLCLEIATIQHGSSEEQDEPWTHPLFVLLQDLVKAMSKAELEDFELDKSVDYSAATNVGKKNYLMATQVVGVYEVLIEYCYISSGYSSDMAKEVLTLFDNYQKLVATIKEKSSSAKKDASNVGKGTKKKENADKGAKGVKKKPVSAAHIRQMPSFLSEHFLITSLKALILDKTPANDEALALLRERTDFQSHLISAAVQKIPTSDSIEESALDESDRFDYCCSLGRLLLQFYMDETVDTISVRLMCINGFTAALNVICNHFSFKLESFLKKLDKALSRTELSQSNKGTPLETVIKKLQRMVDSTLDQSDQAPSCKLAASLLQAIKILVDKLPNDAQPSSDAINWIENTLKREAIDDAHVLKALLSVAFQLKRQKANYLDLVKELTKDVHKLLGDIDKDVALTNRRNFRTIDEGGASTVVLAVIDELYHCEVNVDWVVTTLKARLSTHDRKDVARKSRQLKQNKLCSCLLTIAAILVELLTSAHKFGANVEAVLRFATKYYATVSEVAKYFISVHGIKTEAVCSRLEKLVKTVNTEVTPTVYPFINYVQDSASEGERRKQTKGVQADVARAKKEAKIIPMLIFNIEQYERYLIQLSKKTKSNDLTNTMKMNTNRDFRIDVEAINKAFEDSNDNNEVDDEDENDQNNDTTREANNGPQRAPSSSTEEGDEDDVSAPPTKRQKTDATTNTPSKRRSLASKSPKLF